ncbi:MAG: hypothetical protein ACI3XI_00430 [Eubacteriales bacterium]
MLYKSELKKIFGNRFFTVVLIILLLANGILAYRDAPEKPKIPLQDIKEFIDYYIENPEEIEQYRRDRKTAINNFYDSEEYLEGVELSDVVPDVYAKSDDYTDDDLLNMLTRVKNANDSIGKKISLVIANGKNNQRLLKKKGYKEDDFLYVYQQKAIDTYTELREPALNNVNFEYVYGWDSWLNYNAGTVLMLVALTLLGSTVFGVEGRCGTLELIRTFKKGRRHTAFAKCAASVTVSAATGVLFCLTSFIGVGIKTGYSSPENAIHAVSGYELVPFVADIWQYALIHIAGVVLAAVVFCTFSTLVAAMFRGATVALAGGALFAALNLLLWRYNYKTINNPLQYLNLFAAADGDALFSYVRGVSIFGEFAHCWIVLVVLSVLLCVIFTLSAVFVFDKFGTKDLRIPIFRDIIKWLRSAYDRFTQRITAKRGLRCRTTSITSIEHYKIYFSRGLILIVIALVVFKAVNTDGHYKDTYSRDEIYYNYLSEVRGEWNEEKHEYIERELFAAKETIGKYTAMQVAYENGKISSKEFRAFLIEYSYAQQVEIPLEAIYNTSQHLKKLDSQGIRGSFVYDTGWKQLNNRQYDIYLYLLIVITGSICFSMEHNERSSSGGFKQILRSTKRGRRDTFRAKCTASLIAALVGSIFCIGLEVFTVIRLWELPDASVPLVSLTQYADAPASLTLWQYSAFVCAADMLAMVLLGLLTFALSCLFGKFINCIIVAAILTLVPHALGKVGLAVPIWCDYFGLQQVDRLAKWSMESNIIGDFGGYAIVLLFWITVTLALILAANRKWVDERR